MNTIINESLIINEDYCNENLALAYLLVHEICFLNNIIYCGLKHATTCVYINCNEVFHYSTADAEGVTNNDGDIDSDSEIIQLYQMVKQNWKFGAIRFVALKRKMRPLDEIVQKMKEDNYWDKELESLPERK